MKTFMQQYMENFIKNKFNHLLMVMIFSFVANPIFSALGIRFPISELIFYITILLTLRVIGHSRKTFVLSFALATVCFMLQLFYQYGVLTLQLHTAAFLISILIYIGFFCYLIKVLMGSIFSSKHVDEDTVKGGICIYVIIGFLWSLLYRLIYFFDATAFSFTQPRSGDFTYFSFTVLTTLGFGDITPINRLAINLTSLEAIIGQIFLAVFIAGLMGMHLTQSQK